MAFDFKKEYKEFYLPKATPEIVDVPSMNYLAVRGSGDPNDPGGAYQQALGVLYALAYTIKMSYKGDHKIDGFLSMWSRLWRAFGGRRASTASITPASPASTGSRSSVCPISSPRPTSSGPGKRRRGRNSWTARRRNFSPSTRASASSSCTWAPTIASRRRWP